ncbi:hypothetical protein [Streptomyces sp. NPDC093225]|uniref:hypothetical protein n=1 Tax=Streptomyces sp. NPDC093225 TaxID=3366034 RepID=UPI0037FE3BE5
MSPFQAHRLTLRRAHRRDAQWLRAALTRSSRRFSPTLSVRDDATPTLGLEGPGA